MNPANMTTINLNGVPYRMRADMVAAYSEHAADRDPFARDELREHPAFDLGFDEGWQKANEENGSAYDEGYSDGYDGGKQDGLDEGRTIAEAACNKAYDEGYADAMAEFASEPMEYDL